MRWVIIYDRVHTIIVKTLVVSSLQVSKLRAGHSNMKKSSNYSPSFH